jgi:hypothetical protein
MITNAILLLCALFCIIGHFFIETRTKLSYAKSYEAFAHIFVGVLIGGCLTIHFEWPPEIASFLLVILIVLSIFELGMFLFWR